MKRGSSLPKRGRTVFGVPILLIGLLCMGRVSATPSSQIWNPSTDVLKSGMVHLGIDNYFSIFKNADKSYALPSDMGFEVGVLKFLEIGADVLEPSPDPLLFNFKLGIPERGNLPALAVGGFGIGTKRNVTDYNIIYGAAAKTLPTMGRLTLGFYRGMNKNLFLDESGKPDGTSLIASWDKALSGKVWACIDYASGRSWYGSLSFGASYAFNPSVSVILGYVVFNNSKVVPNNTLTTQLDINL